MSEPATIHLFVEAPDGQRFECDAPRETRLSVVAAGFFDHLGWQAKGPRRVGIDLVDADHPDRVRRLAGEQSLEEAGLEDDDVLRIFPYGAGPRNAHPDDIPQWIDIPTPVEPAQVHGRSLFSRVDIFGESNFVPDPNLCFVIMPFGDPDLLEVHEDHIVPTLLGCGLAVERGDDIQEPGTIMHQVWSGINRARLVVAEVTGRNPNVMYELGLCHALGKPVIILTRGLDDLPFDLRHVRVINYRFTPRGCRRLEELLEQMARAIMSPAATS